MTNNKSSAKEKVETKNNPKYAVYAIYKNEEKFIKRFLSSVKEADEIVLCDTGSTDDTNAMINTFKEENPTINIKTFRIYVSPFRFDEARNVALSLISKEIDVCIALDIDEYLMENWREALSARWDTKFTRYHHKFKTIWSKDNVSIHLHDRIHNRNGYTWKLPVHEINEYKGEEKICYVDNLWIIHEPDNKKSRSSYFPLLNISVKERPDIWNSWRFLALEYMWAGRYEEATNAIDKALMLSNADKGYLHKIKYYIYKKQNKKDMALLNLNNYILYTPNRREPYFEKASYLHEIGRNIEAYFTLKDAQVRMNKIIDYHYNQDSWGKSFDAFMFKIIQLAKEEGLRL